MGNSPVGGRGYMQDIIRSSARLACISQETTPAVRAAGQDPC